MDKLKERAQLSPPVQNYKDRVGLCVGYEHISLGGGQMGEHLIVRRTQELEGSADGSESLRSMTGSIPEEDSESDKGAAAPKLLKVQWNFDKKKLGGKKLK
ncbi:UNVERIFIED_CONTAM: hypothetical protein K2H54_061181 [Gekko kuhli]